MRRRLFLGQPLRLVTAILRKCKRVPSTLLPDRSLHPRCSSQVASSPGSLKDRARAIAPFFLCEFFQLPIGKRGSKACDKISKFTLPTISLKMTLQPPCWGGLIFFTRRYFGLMSYVRERAAPCPRAALILEFEDFFTPARNVNEKSATRTGHLGSRAARSECI
jgi:hypothetical protein